MAVPKTEVLITVDGAERGRYLVGPGEHIIGLWEEFDAKKGAAPK
jgi:hypothetical protein